MEMILIVEDDVSIAQQLKCISSTVNPNILAITTASATEALNYIAEHEILAFFLDIELEGFSGIDLAKKIRTIQKYEFTPIVFVTGILSRELEAFRQVHCYEFIIKPFIKEEIESVFRKILINYIEYGKSDREDVQDKLMLRFKNHTQVVYKKDILYIEYRNRKIVFGMPREEIEYIHMPLKSIKLMLPTNFLQVHQSFIVNKNHIKEVDFKAQEITLDAVNVTIPIGRSYRVIARGVLDEFF